MSRYIDAVKAADTISKRHGIPLVELEDTFAEIPTADVKEVKHGEWIEDEVDSTCRCSVCGWYTDYDYSYVVHNELVRSDFLFCGHCGARMGGGNDKPFDYAVAREEAIKALEKQIPGKD